MIYTDPVYCGLSNAWLLTYVAGKGKTKIEETEEQKSLRREIRKDWSSMEPRLIEMAHKLEASKLIDSNDYVWIRGKISNLAKHFDRQ